MSVPRLLLSYQYSSKCRGKREVRGFNFGLLVTAREGYLVWLPGTISLD